jgi:hypothetical protein
MLLKTKRRTLRSLSNRYPYEIQSLSIQACIQSMTSVCALFFVSTSVNAAIMYDGGSLNFESSGQSMWGSGTAFRKDESVFLGAQWSNKTASFGGIEGSANEHVPGTGGTIPNPEYPAKVLVWEACDLASPFCNPGPYPSSTLPNPIPRATIDSRTGAELSVKSSGKVGLEFGYSIDSGSVDSTVEFSALAELPDVSVQTTDVINLNTSSALDGGTIMTQSPQVEAYISAIMELSGSVEAKACGIGLGCESGNTAIPTVDMDQRILSIDPNSLKVLDGVLPGDKPLAKVGILNQALTLEGVVAPPGVKLTGPGGLTIASTVPPGPSVSVDLAQIKVEIPDIATSGGKTGANVISSDGRDDLLSLQLDLDGAATIFGGLPPAGLNTTLVDAGGIKIEASLDLIDVDAGPVLGITQDFELEPTLMVDLAFSNPIQIAGMLDPQTSWTGIWADLPDFSLLDTTTFSPTYWLDAMLTNDMGIDLGLVGTLDVLKLGATASVAGVKALDIGPVSLNGVLGLGNSLFETDKFGFSVYDDEFSLGGFNRIAGNAFTINVGPGVVPEPSAIGLLLVGLFALPFARRRA